MPSGIRTTSTAAAGAAERWVLPLVGLLAALSLIPVWTTSLLPLQDLPNHLLKVDILRRYLGGDQSVRTIYDLNLLPFSNYTCYVVILLLTPVTGLIGAAKCFISAYLIAFPIGVYVWLRRVNPQNAVLALVASPLAHNLFLTKGNLNFCAALPLYLIGLVIFVDNAPAHRSPLRFTAIATLLYFTHGVVFLALGLVAGLLVLMDFSWQRAAKLIGFGPGVACLVLTTGIQALHEHGAGAPTLDFAVKGAVAAALEWLLGEPGSAYHPFIAAGWAAVLTACGLYTALTIATEFRGAQPRQWLTPARMWLCIGAVLVVAYLAAPENIADWSHLRPRFIPLAAVTMLAGLQIPQRRRVRAVAAAILIACSLGRLLETTRAYSARGPLVEEYVSGMSAVEPNSSILPIYNGPDSDAQRTNLHSWAYYVIEHGGWSPYEQHHQPLRTARLLYPVVYRSEPWAPEESNPKMTSALAQRAAACYDYLVMWGPSATDAQVLEPYYQRTHSTPHMEIWRNRAGLRKSPPAATPACLAAPEPDLSSTTM